MAALEVGNYRRVNTQSEPMLAFIAPREEAPSIEIRVAFGAVTGRTVTRVEIDRLAAFLLDCVGAVTVVAEDRHEIGRRAEACVHQVRIDVSETDIPNAPAQRRELEQRLIERVDYWLRGCFADRHADLVNLES